MTAGSNRVAPPPDLIIVSGDIANKGNFAAADRWLESIRAAAGVERTHIFVIPGNHDIDRSKVPPEDQEALDLSDLDADNLRRQVDRRWESDSLARLDTKFAAYRQFAEPYAAVTRSSVGTWWHRIELNGIDLQLLGLNSVWTGGSKALDRAGMPVVGRVQRELLGALAEAGTNQPEVSFVLQHNPTRYLNSVDALEHAAWLDEFDAVVFCGHLHESEMAERRSVRGRHLEVMGGALYPGYAHERRYSIGTLALATHDRRFSVALRASSSETYFFSRDVHRYRGAPDGVVQFSQAAGAISLGKPIDRTSAPRDELDMVLQRALLRYEGGKYRLTGLKRYANNTQVPWKHLYVRVWANKYPDDQEAASHLYRRHRLELRDINFWAQCEDDPLDWELEHDHESSKEILLKLGDRNGGLGMLPGETLDVWHGFEISEHYWGPYFECNIRLPTERLVMQVDFPRGALDRIRLVINPHIEGGQVLDEAVAHRSIGDRDIYELIRDNPRRQTRYRLSWQFRSV